MAALTQACRLLALFISLSLLQLASAGINLVKYPTSFVASATPVIAKSSTAKAQQSVGVATPSAYIGEGEINANAAPASPAKAVPKPYGGNHASVYGAGFVPKGRNLQPALPQSKSNGNSIWGTFSAPTLNRYLSGPRMNGWPWGNANSKNTNYYTTMPNTGVTRYYDFTVSKMIIAPDGVPKPSLVINGGFPGPLIEANWGDTISVTVNNDLPDEGTALHWHGLLQKETPFYDGVPSVGQCPIAPGKSFTYTFRADLYGTSWYHSHYSGQYAGGALGPMVIHGPVPAGIQYDVDLGPIVLGDWYHADYFAMIQQVMAPAAANLPPPTSNNSLINGKMNYPCSALPNGTVCTPNAGLSKFKFQSGKKYRLRLINTSGEATIKFSIDNHQMTVFANDFVQIQPYTTNVVTLAVGQRSEVIVTATGNPTDAVWMRSNISTACSLNDGISPGGLAVIYYQNANTNSIPTTSSSVTMDQMNNCANDDLALTVPYLPLTPPPTPATTESLEITFAQNSTGYNLWYINDQTFRADYNDPVLFEAYLGTTDFPDDWAVHNVGSNSSVRFIVYNTFPFSGHPMHMHGHNMYILAQGHGASWDGVVTNPTNPQRRDVQILPPAMRNSDGSVTPSYIVVQIDTDNPGVWPFHCHIFLHVSAGLYINMLERPADIRERQLPMVMAQTCRDWSAWTGQNIPDEIDSGL